MKHPIAVAGLLFSLTVFSLGSANAADLEDKYLDCLVKQLVPVSIFLVNGIKLQGQINDYSKEVILLSNGVDQMVYKHAISTVVPARSVMEEECR